MGDGGEVLLGPKYIKQNKSVIWIGKKRQLPTAVLWVIGVGSGMRKTES
jgi:hypothetical protein